jgi:hypothetical protein
MLPNGICGETVKRITTDIDPEDIEVNTVRLKGKAFRKLGERDLY